MNLYAQDGDITYIYSVTHLEVKQRSIKLPRSLSVRVCQSVISFECYNWFHVVWPNILHTRWCGIWQDLIGGRGSWESQSCSYALCSDSYIVICLPEFGTELCFSIVLSGLAWQPTEDWGAWRGSHPLWHAIMLSLPWTSTSDQLGTPLCSVHATMMSPWSDIITVCRCVHCSSRSGYLRVSLAG